MMEQYMKGHSFAEIARQTGKTDQAVGHMFLRAKNDLWPILESKGVCGKQLMPNARRETEIPTANFSDFK